MFENKNNPFRNNKGSSLAHHQEESIGNKFRAGKFSKGGNFSTGGKFNRGGRAHSNGRSGFARGGRQIGYEDEEGQGTDYELKEKEWGKVKFNPVSASAREEPATPWKKFKSEAQNEAAVASSLIVNIETPAEKELRKKREGNYRKALILEKQKEPTQWESFSNVEKDITETTKFKNKIQKKKSKKIENIQKPNETQPLIANKIVENFDTKNLTITQKNHLRKVITKTTIMAKGLTLEAVVKNMKNEKKRRSKN